MESETTPQAFVSAPRTMKAYGDPIGSATEHKRWETNVASTYITTRSLLTRDLLAIPRNSTSENVIGKRNGEIVDVKGVKLCMEYWNNANLPAFIRFAIVSRKDSNAPPSELGFFRGVSDTRGSDLDIANSSLDLQTRVINSDVYTVHHEWIQRMDSAMSSTNTYHPTSHANWGSFEKYFSVNRRFFFSGDNNAAFPENGNLYLVYWADLHMKAGGSPPSSLSVKVAFRTVAYYSEPC